MKNLNKPLIKLFGFGLIGVFFFFVPVSVDGKTTIPIDHIVSFIKTRFPIFSKIFALALIFAGAITPFLKNKWKENKTALFFSAMKLLGLFIAVGYLLNFLPAQLYEKDILPFLFDKLVVPVGLIVPVGAIFLSFLVDYGLLEFVGVFMEKVMRPVWKTPGRSAVDALASFVGSYSIALLITDKVFAEGKYTVKEAAIIATGFSTVSATFMVIVAKTTGLMDYWNFYFWTTLLITFIVTAVTVRVPPLSKMNDKENVKIKTGDEENESLFDKALKNGIEAADKTTSVSASVKNNLLDGLKMASNILPSILSIGLIGLLLAKFTPVFDLLGYVYYPFVKALGLPDAQTVAKAVSLEIAEMFLPALIIGKAEIISRYVVAVTSVSAILFFSASIPTILSTRIPIKISDMIIIWFERTLLSLLFASAFGYLFF